MTDTNSADDSRSVFLKQIALLAVGELLAAGLTCVVFLILGKYDLKVLLGGLLGAALALGNFAVMAFFLTQASKKALDGNVKGGQGVTTGSMIGRYLVLALVLFLVAKTKAVNAIALVVPLALFRVILSIEEMIRTKEEEKKT